MNDQMLYTPPARYVGTDQFNYQVTDGALTSTGVVYVLISSSSISADTVDSTAADTVTPTISTNTSALRILSTAPYGRDGERVGMLVDWNDVAGALYYQITSYRQDTAGSASPSTVTTKSQWGTGAHPNAGEEDGYCYYRRVRVNAVNNKGVVFASATAESCYMADEDNEPGKYPPAVTRLSPQVQGASTDANTLHIMNQIESLQKKLNDLLAR